MANPGIFMKFTWRVALCVEGIRVIGTEYEYELD